MTESLLQDAAYVPKHAFSDFPIREELKRNITNKNYTEPTPIQDQAIPSILENKDVIGIANTGTGKTAAFLIPLINKVFHDPMQRVLIVVPTRELAVQIDEEFKAFAKDMNIFSVLCIGGASIHNQIYGIRRNHNFIIGTPGRLKDLKMQKKLNFALYNNVVLDEVDRMLDMGFIVDVRFIISHLPNDRQSLFFSATVSFDIQQIIRTFLKNPITISVKSQEMPIRVDQDVIKINGRNKIDVLHDLLIQDGFDKVLIFGRTKWGMEKLARLLAERGFRVAAIHGNKSQNQRQRALEQFRENHVQVLLATDIASRGLDIDDITHVINYDQPASYEDYIHRIGRTGRAGKAGTALTFVA
ncbi:MAG: hypothetical protein A2698_00770 [Candidatus Levybacteria bacterium RIFCSPHIGHO2_01_FULL_42_15]|nr:MAG: hypothetical protein A2698_00770 [Candidatus Levybacteria bacterium RIFCSPHIGHO2_01_FULL_42_15]